MKKIFLSLFVGLQILSVIQINAQSLLSVWPDKIPNRIASEEQEEVVHNDILWYYKVQEPQIEVYLPTKQNSTDMAVMIMPGGGYTGLAYDWEGTDMAKWWNSKGVAAFVLKYRLPLSKSLENKEWVPLQDAQRAIRVIRSKAKEYNIDPKKIGIMGFSAGGHLASTLGTHYDQSLPFMNDEIDQISARPDFQVLVYPVISMKEEITHGGSRNNLIGSSPSKELVEIFSNELHVDEETPPTFLLHATDDNAVKVENSLVFYQALKDHRVPVEMHIFPSGGHGFAFGRGNDALEQWTDLLIQWVRGLY